MWVLTAYVAEHGSTALCTIPEGGIVLQGRQIEQWSLRLSDIPGGLFVE